MKKINIGLIFFAVIFVSCAGSPKTKGAADSQEARLKIYFDVVKDAGLSPQYDEDGDIEFRRDGIFYYISVSDKSPEFVQLYIPNVWEITSDDEKEMVYNAAMNASRKTKVAKVFISEDSKGPNVIIAAELYFPQAADFYMHFGRLIDILQVALDHFDEEMQ